MEEQKQQGSKRLALLLIGGPIIASAVRIPMMLQNTDSGYGMGGLIGWIVGSLVSIAIGVAILLRDPKS